MINGDVQIPFHFKQRRRCYDGLRRDGQPESYRARARQRLEQVQQTEEAAAEEALDRLDRKLEQTMRAVEASYEKNKERWVDTLFSLIVGVQP